MPAISVELGDAARARALFESICHLYDEVFSTPPFHWEPNESEQHRQRPHLPHGWAWLRRCHGLGR